MEQSLSPLERVETELLLEGIYRIYGYDFRQYAFASVSRRILHRMHGEGLKSVSALQEQVLRDPKVWRRLFNDICVPVTEMFRDPTFYDTIRKHVVPELRKENRIRIWHAGCSTGQEVYSLAILLLEEQLYDRCRIYATDINEDWLAIAKEGKYPIERMQSYTRNYILSGGFRPFSDYYTAVPPYALIEELLKRNITFARHNLTSDESFNEFHLIICRNVLIYFNPELQKKTLQLFRKSLSPSGFLALGSREAITPSRETSPGTWVPFEARQRIYKYKELGED